MRAKKAQKGVHPLLFHNNIGPLKIQGGVGKQKPTPRPKGCIHCHPKTPLTTTTSKMDSSSTHPDSKGIET